MAAQPLRPCGGIDKHLPTAVEAPFKAEKVVLWMALTAEQAAPFLPSEGFVPRTIKANWVPVLEGAEGVRWLGATLDTQGEAMDMARAVAAHLGLPGQIEVVGKTAQDWQTLRSTGVWRALAGAATPA